MADDAEQPLDPVEEEAVADGEVEVRSEQEQQKFESDFAIKMVDTLVAINEQQISSYELPNRFFTTDELNCFGFSRTQCQSTLCRQFILKMGF